MTANLTWSDHIKNIKAKASRTVGYIRRNLKASPSHVKNVACNTYIRSKLEYAASVWNPHQIYLINNLESVQNRAARFTLFEYDRTTSVSALKNQLNLPPLQVHRKIAPLSALHKINYYHPTPRDALLRSLLRSSTRQGNSRTIARLSGSTNAFNHCFFPQTIVDWNNLPDAIVTIENSEAFRTELLRLFD